MSQKAKIFLGLAFALIILVIIYLFWPNSLTSNRQTGSIAPITFGNLDNAQKIELSKAGKTTVIDKLNDTWVISSENNAEANPALIDNLLKALKDLKQGTIISQNKDILENFGLSEDTAGRIKISDNQNNVMAELLIGKTGAIYTQSYLKLTNSDQILLVNQNFTSLLSTTNWKKPEPTPTSTPSPTPAQ